jgi:hypothetical protein
VGSLLDIHPAEVLVIENYRYKAKVRKNDSLKISGLPMGLVRMRLPYDGEHYFPRSSAEWIKERSELASLKIGSVALGEPKDWNGTWEQQIGVEVLDVEIPLRTADVSEEQWSADELVIECSHEYKPEQPHYFPIQVQIEVLDRYAIHPMWLVEKYYQKDEFWKQLTEASSRVLSGKNLSFEVTVKVNLPSILGGNDLMVRLERMTFGWPKIPSRSQFEMHQWNADQQSWDLLDWNYKPEQREITLGPIQMPVGPRSKNGNPLITYQTLIRVDLEFATGDLLQRDELRGTAVVHIDDTLLSGRDVAWIHASGMKSDSTVKVKKRTILESEFEVSLSEQFEIKRSFLSRRWIFPGVSPQVARLNDIGSVLLDMGYALGNPIDGGTRIAARRQIISPGQGLSELFFWIQMTENTPAPTTRERKLEGEEKMYRTEIPTRGLTIDLYAQMNGVGGILALDAENLMIRLKDQFTAVADPR